MIPPRAESSLHSVTICHQRLKLRSRPIERLVSIFNVQPPFPVESYKSEERHGVGHIFGCLKESGGVPGGVSAY